MNLICFLFIAFMLSVSTAHDPSKCRADASGTQSCCSTKDKEASCADEYLIAWSD